MVLKILSAYILFNSISYSLYGLQSLTCDAPPQQWIDKIHEIRIDTNLSIEKKIADLTSVQSSYLKCSGKKKFVMARMLHRLGDFYFQNNILDTSIILTKEAIRLNSENSNDSEKSYLSASYFNLATHYQSLGLIAEALSYYDLVVQHGIEFPSNAWLIKLSYLYKAVIYRQTGEFQKCIENADQGIIFPDMEADLQTKGNLLIQKIQAQIELNMLDQAKRDLIQLSELAFNEENQYLEIVDGYYTTNALLFKKEKQFQQTIENLEKSLAINKEVQNDNQFIRNLIDIGFTYDEGFNQKDKAIEIYQEALKLATDNDQFDLVSQIYNNLGVAFWRTGNFDKALLNYQQALRFLGIDSVSSIVTENPSVPEMSNNLNSRLLVTILGNKAESLLELSKTEGDVFLEASIKTHLLAVKMIDHMRWNQLTLESKLYWRDLSKEVFENALEACFLRQNLESAYYFLEKSRAVMLSDKLSELGAKQFIPLEEKLKESTLRTKLHQLQTEISVLAETSPEYPQKKLNYLAISDSLNYFVKTLEQKYPVYFQYKYDTTFHNLSDLKNVGLEKDQGFLSLFVGDKYIYKFYIDEEKPTLARVEVQNFRENINQLMQLVSNQERLNQNFQDYLNLSNQLYVAIFNDLSIRKSRLIVCLDEILFPFDMLITDSQNPSSFLLSDYAISYTYSADYLIENRAQKAKPIKSLLGIAPVSYAPHLKQVPLPGADFSLHRIKNYFSSNRILTFTNATKENFLKNINQYSIVQLYTHAEADILGTEPYLIFSDKILKLSELQFIGESTAQLVILSACNTGVGEYKRGEGIFSLARAFSAAGIPSGINSLWKIDSKSTYQITELFHKYLSEGIATDQALRQAKLDFMDGNSYESLPYFWGANVLVGPAIVFKSSKITWLWVSCGILFIVALVLGIIRYLKL